MANVNGTTDINEQMETMDVMYLVYGAISEADESLMHDAKARATIGSKVDYILCNWIYTSHGGIVKEASKALEAIESVIGNHSQIPWLSSKDLEANANAMMEVLTTYACAGR
jgi:hypothetical protein